MSKSNIPGTEPENAPAPASRATVGGKVRPKRRVAERLLSPGERIANRYKILEFVAAGGMGEVYAAFDEALNATIALKTLVADLVDEKRIERFRNEIQLARKVTHPNVCRIFDLGQHTFADGDPRAREPLLFLTMELVEGPTLLARIQQGPLRLDEAERITAQMAGALAAAHDSGVIHRDFKSSNVLLRMAKAGESRGMRAVVTDFGLALPADTHHADRNEALGTPEYMAPEQLRGETLTAACDVYALGIVLYEMVTGELPFPSDDPFYRLDHLPPPPREKRPELPERWERAIEKCLAREPKDRFASPLDVAAAIAKTASAGPRSRMPLVVGAVAVAAMGALGVASWRRHAAQTERATAAELAAARAAAERAATENAPRPKRRRTVAVLGFKNASGRADAAWLSTALGEMLTNELGAGEGVRVIAPDTVARVKMEMAFSDGDAVTSVTLRRLRDRLGADLVADGSYLVLGSKDAARVRVDLRLQETNAGETVASASDQAPESQLFELVSRAGDKLRVGIGAEKLPEREATLVRASLPSNPEAARLYAEGLAELRRFESLAARDHLQKAAALEPQHPFVHSALSAAWSTLGYDANAQAEAKRAFDLSSHLSPPLARADRLTIEARYRETLPNWDEAIRIYRALYSFFPDDLQYGLRLANAELQAGHGRDALATLAELRKLPPPDGSDPSIDLAEAMADETLSEFKHEKEASERAIAKAEKLGARFIVERARITGGAAQWGVGDAKGALASYEDSKRIALAAGDRDMVARALQMIANTHAMQQQPAAQPEFEESLRIYREIGDRRGEAGTLGGMATMVSDADPAAACKLYEQALAIDRLVGDKRRIAVELNNLAVSYEQLGRIDDAGKRFAEAAAVFHEAGYESAAGSAMGNQAANMLNHGDVDGARDTALAAVQKSRATESQPDIAWATSVLATVLRESDDRDGASRRIEQAIAIAKKLAQGGDVAAYAVLQARLALDAGHPADAERIARAAADTAKAAESPLNEAFAWAAAADALVAAGRLEEAKAAIARARAAQPKSGVDPDHVVALASAEANVLAAAGDRAAAIEILRAAVAKAKAAGYVLHALTVRAQLAAIDPSEDARDVAAEARRRGLLRLARVAGALPQRR
jgi:eukaryotic-like serine/threonine-protein kinase